MIRAARTPGPFIVHCTRDGCDQIREVILEPGRQPFPVSDAEFAFGDFSAGRFGWVLQDVQPLTTPVPCKGSLGLWTVPSEVRAAVSAQVKVCA